MTEIKPMQTFPLQNFSNSENKCPIIKHYLKKREKKIHNIRQKKTEHITLAQESNTGFTMAVTSVITSEQLILTKLHHEYTK